MTTQSTPPQSTYEKIVQELDNLPVEQHQQVLTWLRSLRQRESENKPNQREVPKGTPGASLSEFVGIIPAADLKEMQLAIEEACEVIDVDGW
jgi:hypothetical protein